MSIFKDIEVSEKFFLRNLEVYPLRYTKGNGSIYVSLDEALRDGTAKVKDVYGVNAIGVLNINDRPLLMLEGESLQGARQDRIVNVTSILEPEVETVLPVSCVEQNRWQGASDFSTSLTLAFPSLRSILRSSVYNSLKASKKMESDQSAIWEEVKKTLTVTHTRSETLSMHDAYASLKEDIQRYVSERGNLRNMHGYMVFIEEGLVSLDVFASSELLKKYERKLFESYAMQGMLYIYGQKDLKKVKLDPKDLDMLDSVDFEDFQLMETVYEKRYRGDFLINVTFNKNNEFVYASVVPSHS